MSDADERELARLTKALHAEMKHPDFRYAFGVADKFGPDPADGWVENPAVHGHGEYSAYHDGVSMYWCREFRPGEQRDTPTAHTFLLPDLSDLTEIDRATWALHYFRIHPDWEYTGLDEERSAQAPDGSWVVNEVRTTEIGRHWEGRRVDVVRPTERPQAWMRPRPVVAAIAGDQTTQMQDEQDRWKQYNDSGEWGHRDPQLLNLEQQQQLLSVLRALPESANGNEAVTAEVATELDRRLRAEEKRMDEFKKAQQLNKRTQPQQDRGGYSW